MPTLEYFLVAESCSVDQSTNKLSIFNVIEELTPHFAEGAEWPIVLQEIVAISGWNPSPGQEQSEEHELTTRLVAPGREPQNYSQNVIIQPGRRSRLMNRIAGTQIGGPGEFTVEILIDGVHAARHTITIRDAVPLEPD